MDKIFHKDKKEHKEEDKHHEGKEHEGQHKESKMHKIENYLHNEEVKEADDNIWGQKAHNWSSTKHLWEMRLKALYDDELTS